MRNCSVRSNLVVEQFRIIWNNFAGRGTISLVVEQFRNNLEQLQRRHDFSLTSHFNGLSTSHHQHHRWRAEQRCVLWYVFRGVERTLYEIVSTICTKVYRQENNLWTEVVDNPLKWLVNEKWCRLCNCSKLFRNCSTTSEIVPRPAKLF